MLIVDFRTIVSVHLSELICAKCKNTARNIAAYHLTSWVQLFNSSVIQLARIYLLTVDIKKEKRTTTNVFSKSPVKAKPLFPDTVFDVTIMTFKCFSMSVFFF